MPITRKKGRELEVASDETLLNILATELDLEEAESPGKESLAEGKKKSKPPKKTAEMEENFLHSWICNVDQLIGHFNKKFFYNQLSYREPNYPQIQVQLQTGQAFFTFKYGDAAFVVLGINTPGPCVKQTNKGNGRSQKRFIHAMVIHSTNITRRGKSTNIVPLQPKENTVIIFKHSEVAEIVDLADFPLDPDLGQQFFDREQKTFKAQKAASDASRKTRLKGEISSQVIEVPRKGSARSITSVVDVPPAMTRIFDLIDKDKAATIARERASHELEVIRANNFKDVELQRLAVFQKQAETISNLASLLEGQINQGQRKKRKNLSRSPSPARKYSRHED